MAALTDRDTNIKMATKPAFDGKPSSGSYEPKSQGARLHRQLFENRNTDSNGNKQAYVSPSDAILSPASQKLAGFKQKQINKQNNKTARTLFARTPSSNSGGFDDINAQSSSEA